jgi:hypothetical protein
MLPRGSKRGCTKRLGFAARAWRNRRSPSPLPRQPTELDDGLLTASEVAEPKLNADWVVLSACNTAAADKPGAEALSGLTRAFFHAGGGRFWRLTGRSIRRPPPGSPP